MGQQSAILDRLLVLNTEMAAALKAAEIEAEIEQPIDMAAYRVMPRNIRNARFAVIFAEPGAYQEERLSAAMYVTRQFRLVALVRQVQLDRQADDDQSLAYEETDRFLDFFEGYYHERRRLQTNALSSLAFLTEDIRMAHNGAALIGSVNRMNYVGAVITLTLNMMKKVR